MLNRLKPKSEFTRNVLTLMTGTTVAQAIPIAISPILTRIYTPEDFGAFALYTAIVAMLSVITTGQYDLAIMLPKYEKNAINIVGLSLLINSLFSIFISVIIILFFDNFQTLLGNRDLGNLLYLIPLSVFLIGSYQIFNYWLNRKKQYKILSTNKVVQSLTNSTSSVSLGLQDFGKDGLIISQLLAQGFIVALLIRKVKINFLFQHFNKLKFFALAKKYVKFPKITMMQSLFSTLTVQLPVMLISTFFTLKGAGFYSLANRVIATPIGIVSSSLFQVFYQSFIIEKNKINFYKSKFIQINILLLPFFIVFWFFLESLFSFVFGEEWVIAGEYARILLPLLYMKFISNLFTTTTYLYYEMQIENFVISVVISIMAICSLLIGVLMNDIVLGLILMTISNSLIIIFKLYRSYEFVKKDKNVRNI